MTPTIPTPPVEETSPPTPNAQRPTPNAPKRMLQLDILRGVAILLVIFFHDAIPAWTAGPLRPLTQRLDRMGWSGVDLFFVLSGFLIGGLLFKELLTEGRLDVRRFIIRRAFKIWPSYYLYLLYLAVLSLVLPAAQWIDTPKASPSLIPNLLHIQNYARPPRGHTWSLAVEEHFYLALPFLLALLVSRGQRTLRFVPYIAATVAIACLSLRYLTSFQKPWAQYTHYFPTHLRIDALFFGVTLAYFYHYKPEFIRRLIPYRLALLVAGILLVAPTAFYHISAWLISVPGFTLIYIGYGCILMAVILTPLGEGIGGKILASPVARALAFVGVYSFPIYLWHVDCARYPLRYLCDHGFLAFLPGALRWLAVVTIYILVATAVGVLMGRLVEKPALALRDRLFPSKISPIVTEGVPTDAKTPP